MNLSGEHLIPAPRQAVWKALNDPEVLQACIPGCEEMTRKSPTELSAKIHLKIGPIRASFSGEVELKDIVVPESYVIGGKGTGGVAGFARGEARVRLEQNGECETRLVYEVEAAVGGKLAQLGQRLLRSTTNKLAGQFFDSFVERFNPSG